MEYRKNPEDFSLQNLEDHDFSGKNLVEANFRATSLRRTDLTECNLYRADFRGARFLDAKLSMNCATFHGIKLDGDQVRQFLYLLCLASFDNNLKHKIHEIIGPDALRAYDRMFGSKRT